MSALDFPNPPLTVGQQYNATNGALYTWDGAVWGVSGPASGQAAGGDLQGFYPNPTIIPSHLPWTVSGAALTPTDATKNVTIVGTGSMTTLTLGAATAKGRVQAQTTGAPGAVGLFANRDWTANAQDDATKPSWGFFLNPATGGDNLIVQRSPAGSTTQTNLLMIDANANLLLSTSAGPARGGLGINPTAGGAPALVLMSNGLGSALDNTAVPGWQSNQGGADSFRVLRSPAGATPSYATLLTLDNAGNLTILGATATKASGTTWANPSDRRLKDDITDYTLGLAAICALRPRTFLYNGKGGSRRGLRGYGYVADEAVQAIPEMLGTTRAKLDADDVEESEIQSLDTSNVTLALVNAVRELAAQIQDLKRQIA